jgi:predicted CopG family antitoxin
MQKKLTITIDEHVYEGLHNIVGRGRISHFIESLVRPHIVKESLDAAYREMSLDKDNEKEAMEWSEEMIGDIANETW